LHRRCATKRREQHRAPGSGQKYKTLMESVEEREEEICSATTRRGAERGEAREVFVLLRRAVSCGRGQQQFRLKTTNGLRLQHVPQSSFGFCALINSIPTAPTNHLPDWSGLNKFTRGQKGADKLIGRRCHERLSTSRSGDRPGVARRYCVRDVQGAAMNQRS
jgi:hypothetical protein